MLSKEEIDFARRTIDQYRKFARQWRALRWALLLAGVLMLVIMTCAWWQLETLENFDAETLPAEPRGRELRDMLVERVDMLRIELKLYFSVFLHAVLGPVLIVAALYGWNRWPLRYSLKARLLESALESEAAAGKTLEFMKEEDA